MELVALWIHHCNLRLKRFMLLVLLCFCKARLKILMASSKLLGKCSDITVTGGLVGRS